jgi:transcriptional regulator with XRE-family HTH domain
VQVSRRPNPVFTAEYKAIVSVLIAARREAGLSQRTLARRIGKTSSHVCMIERGQRRVDALELYRIAKSLGVSPSRLFARIEDSLDGVARQAA